jgi:hypothetical protein
MCLAGETMIRAWLSLSMPMLRASYMPGARQCGVLKLGRKPKLTDHQKREAIRWRDHGDETLEEIGRSYNVSAATISRLAA